ncbi:MAG TPA: YidC/Oxa1 family membrane protein insertase [Candidatus Peribacteraceae bacterium]|nr:YidC/Oxa1 family membrane protein insertase [Candidatus Peribacteraceae bacterium]
MAAKNQIRQILEFALIFALIYLGSQYALKQFFPEQFGGETVTTNQVTLKPQDASVKGGHHPVLMLRNDTEKELTLKDRCPNAQIDIFYSATGDASVAGVPLVALETVLPCAAIKVVTPKSSVTLDLSPWKYSLFSEYGQYAARLTLPEGFEQKEVVAQFSIQEAGPLTKIFRTFITKPFLNFLIFIASLLPDHNLGIAIIVLTIIVKLLLFFPTQHALQGQKEMQKLQPKLDALKKQYGSDPQKMQQETMKLWKEHKVNPFQSCLPLLIQFPILIGLFYTVRDGSVLELSKHLIYASYQHLPWTFNTNFFGLDLLKPEYYVIPASLVIMQFIQMKLSFALNERKKTAEQKEKEKESKEMSPQKMQQNVMLYGLPIMIGVFAFQFPAAVSLYWGISTLFAIGQQLVVNRKTA